MEYENTDGTVRVDVLVVGLSISGISLAKELSISRHSFLCVEKNPCSSKESKATGVHPHTLDMIQHWGVNGQVKESGTELLGMKIMHGGRVISTQSFENGDMSIPQDVLEDIILKSFSTTDNFHWSTRMTEFTITKDGSLVVKCVSSDKNVLRVHCKYMFACDGASSSIRRKCHFEFESITPMSARSACFNISHGHSPLDGVDKRYMHIISKEDRDRRVVFVPVGPTGWKVSLTKLASEQEAHFDKLLAEVEQRCGLKLNADDCEQLSYYNTQSRISEAFHNKEGNIFLVGDSAHTYLPFGGHGLNEAVADAIQFGTVLREEECDLGQRLVDMAKNRRGRALEVLNLVGLEKTKYYPSNPN